MKTRTMTLVSDFASKLPTLLYDYVTEHNVLEAAYSWTGIYSDNSRESYNISREHFDILKQNRVKTTKLFNCGFINFYH